MQLECQILLITSESGTNSFKPKYLSSENVFLRLSKYPSKSYIGYGLF